MKQLFLTTALAVATICPTMAVADHHKDKSKQHAQKGPQAPKELVQYFTGRLMLMNHSTIMMSDLAARETDSKDVQDFAGKLHEGHAKLNRQLAEHAPKIPAIANLDSAGKPHKSGFRGSPVVEREAAADRQAEKAPRNRGEPKKSFDSPLMQALSIERKATDNYLLESTTMLSKHEDQDFDMGYLGFQIGQHTWMLAELKAMESIQDQQFQKLVSSATDHIQTHLKEARKLARQYEDDSEK